MTEATPTSSKSSSKSSTETSSEALLRTSAAAQSEAPPATQAPDSKRSRRWLRYFVYAFVGVVLVLALGLAALWQWAGREGSLTQVLSWGQRYLPPDALGIEGLQGALRRGGQAQHLRWHQGGLTIDVYDARYAWNPLTLLSGRLHFTKLSARHIRIDDQRPPSNDPPSAPPETLGLPLGVSLDAFTAGKLEIVSPTVFSATEVTGRYLFDGADHRLHLENATIAKGSYQADVRLGAEGAPDIDARLSGNFLSPAPEGNQGVPLSVNARVHGPLTEMRAEAQVRGQATQSGSPAARADATARITPWAAQPLPEAQAEFADLDVAPFWPKGPQTRLTGRLEIKPGSASTSAEAETDGWQIKAQIVNALPGPWDQRRLPLSRLDTQATWQSGIATVQSLKAELAGGTFETTGSWSSPNKAPASANLSTSDKAGSDSGSWQLVTALRGIDPGKLHTQLAPFPIDGRATVSGEGTAIDFDADLQARAQRQPTSQSAGETPAQALARDLSALRLQSASAQGRWQDGLLRIAKLNVRATDAELTGTNMEVRTDSPSGKGQLQLSAPGTLIKLEGAAAERAGGGTLSAEVSNLARTFDWVKKLPGVPPELDEASATGQLNVIGSWQGGWTDPSVKLRLEIPTAEWRSDTADRAATPIKLRSTLLNLSGRLAQAEFEVRGTLAQGERTLTWKAIAEAGRTRVGSTLAASSWQGALQQLELAAFDANLSGGRANAPWRLQSKTSVPFTWAPAPGAGAGGQFSAGAGELILTAPTPDVSTSQATIAWQPVLWRAGTLSTSGRVTGLPLAWAELFVDPKSADTGVTGDVVFNGQWNAQLGDTMRIDAELARTSGDLVLTTQDADTGVRNRIAAGLKDARLQLRSQGQSVEMRLNWDTEQLGTASGELRSQLVATKQADGETSWSWPESAPISGQVKAALPRISAWSTLAPPGWRMKGSLAADVRIAGTRSSPHLTGTLGADDLAMRSVVDGIELSGGRLRGRLDGQRLIVDEFTLRGGGPNKSGGSLRATGEAAIQNGQVRATMNASIDRLHASMRTDRLVIVSGQLQAGMAGNEATLNGRLQVDKASITLPDETAPSLGGDVVVRGTGKAGTTNPSTSAAAQKPPAEPGKTSGRATLNANVQIDLGNDFRVSGMGIDTRLAGQLQVTTSGAIGNLPRVAGTINTIGGTFRAYSQQLNIDNGEIRFNGPATNPSLSILALRPNYQSDQRVGVQITGSALLPRIRLYAQPDLPDTEKLAWLMLGRAAPSSGAESALLQQAALAIMGGREGRSVASRFGLDELSFSGGSDTNTGTTGATVTLGKRLSDKLYATYEHSLAGAMGALFVYYELSRRWLLRGQAGERSAVDLIFTLSFD